MFKMEPRVKRNFMVYGAILFLVAEYYLPLYTVDGIGVSLFRLAVIVHSIPDLLALFSPVGFMFIGMVSGTKEKWAQLVLKGLRAIFSIGGLGGLLWSVFKNVLAHQDTVSLAIGFPVLLVCVVFLTIGLYWPGTRDFGDPEVGE